MSNCRGVNILESWTRKDPSDGTFWPFSCPWIKIKCTFVRPATSIPGNWWPALRFNSLNSVHDCSMSIIKSALAQQDFNELEIDLTLCWLSSGASGVEPLTNKRYSVKSSRQKVFCVARDAVRTALSKGRPIRAQILLEIWSCWCCCENRSHKNKTFMKLLVEF